MIEVLLVKAVQKTEKSRNDDQRHARTAQTVHCIALFLVLPGTSFLKQSIEQIVPKRKKHKHACENNKVAYPYHQVSGIRRISAVNISQRVCNVDHRIHKQTRDYRFCRFARSGVVHTYRKYAQ